MSEKCEDCRFFWAVMVANSPVTECRRRAPTVTNENGDAVFPVMSATGWCGEFEQKPGEWLRNVV